MISGSADKTVKLWTFDSTTAPSTSFLRISTRDNAKYSLKTLTGHSGSVNCVTMTDKHAISGGSDKKVKVWDFASGKLVDTLDGHSDAVFAIYADNDRVLSGCKFLRIF